MVLDVESGDGSPNRSANENQTQVSFFDIRFLESELRCCNGRNDFVEVVGNIDEVVSKLLLTVNWVSGRCETLAIAIIAQDRRARLDRVVENLDGG